MPNSASHHAKRGGFQRKCLPFKGFGPKVWCDALLSDKLLGVEIEKERVEAALPYTHEKTFFRLGGFNLPLEQREHVRLIRAFNVLRQYEEKDFAPAYERLASYVLPGGLTIEGTSDPFGSVWCANVARRVMESDSLLSRIGD